MRCPESPDKVKVHFNKARKLWYRTIGARPNGNPWKRYFGKDETLAKVAAWELMREVEGRWEHESEDERTVVATDVRKRIESVEQDDANARLLSTSVSAYLDAQRRRLGLMGSAGISQSTFEQKEYRIRRAIEFVKVETIDALDFKAMESAIYLIAARPELKQKRRTGRVSQITALAYINALREFCIWLADAELKWELPKRIHAVWKIRPEPDERNLRTLSPDEVRQLWQHCSNKNARRDDGGRRRRLFMLLGLNCGWYQSDIGTMNEGMVVENGTVIWRLRKKTRKQNSAMTRTRWKLWPETRMLLRRYGIPDATPNQIRMAWERLVETSGVDVPFSTLRDTGANFIRSIAGDDAARAYLGHSRGTMLDHYSQPSWDRLDDAVMKMREKFVVEPKRKKPE